MTTRIKNKPEPIKKTSHKQKHKKNTNKEDNESKECKHKRQVGPNEGSVPNTKTKNKKGATKNPSLPQNIFQEHQTKTCSVDEGNPPKKNNDYVKGHLRSPKGKQNQILVVSIVFLFKCARGRGAWGEEETQDEKEEE